MTTENTLFSGTIVRVAIQCACPDTGKVGSFFFRGDSHRETGSRVSPVFADCHDLFVWSQEKFSPVGHAGLTYTAKFTHEPQID